MSKTQEEKMVKRAKKAQKKAARAVKAADVKKAESATLVDNIIELDNSIKESSSKLKEMKDELMSRSTNPTGDQFVSSTGIASVVYTTRKSYNVRAAEEVLSPDLFDQLVDKKINGKKFEEEYARGGIAEGVRKALVTSTESKSVRVIHKPNDML